MEREAVYDVNRIRERFPILKRKVGGVPLVYLDNASTTQKPDTVIDAISDFYRNHCGNVHRGVHTLTRETTEIYENARRAVAGFIGAADPAEIVFTRNATEAIHLVAWSWAWERVNEGDEIILSEMEHHSNMVPWQMLAREKKANLKLLGLGPNEILDPGDLERMISPRTRLITLIHVSNTLGVINPIDELSAVAHRHNIPIFIDGAQGVPHLPTDVSRTGCDFLAFSGHKMTGPTGVGILYGKKKRLEAMRPFLAGGGMVDQVGLDSATFNAVPYRFEAGTPSVADAAGLAAAVEFLESLGMADVRRHEEELTARALQGMEKIRSIALYGPDEPALRTGVISFNLAGVEPHALGRFLDTRGVAIRAGDHCTQPLLRALGITATARVSFYLYNTLEEVDTFVALLEEAARRPRNEWESNGSK